MFEGWKPKCIVMWRKVHSCVKFTKIKNKIDDTALLPWLKSHLKLLPVKLYFENENQDDDDD